MTRSELIAKIAAENPHLYARDVELIVATVFDTLTDALVAGNRVELRGFGTFSVKTRNARKARNPKTGSPVEVGQKSVPFFKAGKQLRENVDKSRFIDQNLIKR